MTHPRGASEPLVELLTWLNQRFATNGRIDEATPLFASGLINSIRILEIIAWVESTIGRPVPDRQIRMDNFASAGQIAAVFLGGAHVDS